MTSGLYTNSVQYVMVGKVCAFTSASCSINPVSLEEWLVHHLQLQKTVLLRRHLPSSALILSLLSRLAHITLTGGTQVVFQA